MSDQTTDTDRLAEIGQAIADLDTVVDGTSGVKGRYGWNFSGVSQHVNMHADLKWLLDHVDRLNAVLADEVPDVDGWFLRPGGRTDVVLGHESNPDHMQLFATELPLGAVLAFIADQEEGTDGD